MPNTTTENGTEGNDAKRVNTAVGALQAGDTQTAESLLLEVIRNTPKEYVYEYETEGARVIKFWDTQEFLHYVAWQKKQGEGKPLKWVESAYPKACYYLGFLKVQLKEFESAVAWLDQGLALEPTNPKFLIEKAHALIGRKRYADALALYESVKAVGPHASPHEVAVALRGRGFVLAEMGELNPAQKAFEESLTFESDNEIARNELEYIARVREGGLECESEAVVTLGARCEQCSCCGQIFTRGSVAEVDGRTIYICEKCEKKYTKRWWQFWK